MKKNKLLAEDWFEIADKDLEISKKLLKDGQRYIGFAAFHCQQAFEKYLKGIIVFHGKLPEKTHNLQVLLKEVLNHHLEFMKYLDTSIELTPCAVVPRYPDEYFVLTISKLKKLIKKTEDLQYFVKEYITTYE